MNPEKIKELSDFATEASGNEHLMELISSEDVSFPLAFAIEYGFASATEKGFAEMQATYDYLMSLVKERDLNDMWDLLHVEEKIPQRPMSISLD